MRLKHIVTIVLLIAFATMSTSFMFNRANASPVMSVVPSTKIIALIGDDIAVNVTVDYAVNLYGYEFWLSFNNTVLNATDLQPTGNWATIPAGWNYPLNPPVREWYWEINNPSGYVTIARSTYVTQNGKTGGGDLGIIRFKALAAGDSTLHLYNTHLVNNASLEITHTRLDGEIFVNTPPVAGNLTITPSIPYTNDNLNANYDYYDADGNLESGTEIRWYKNSVLQPLLNDTKIVPNGLTNKTEIWYFTVKPKDGMHFGTLQTSPSVTIQNSPPTGPAVDVTPDLPKTDDDLTCTVTTASTDPDGDSVNYIYAWYKDSVLNQSTTKAGLTDTLPKAKTKKGEVWNCTVTPTDGTANGTSASDKVTIQNSAPSGLAVNVTPDLPVTDDDLTCTVTTASTDPDGDTVTYTYNWYKNTVFNQTTSKTGLTDTLSKTKTVKGEVWNCTVTPSDGSLNGPSASDQVTIQNSAPNAPVVDVTPDLPKTDDNLLCTVTTASSDPDGDTITYTYVWYKNGVLNQTTSKTGLTDTLSNTLTLKGEVWNCTVRASDGALSGPPASDKVTIQNSAPSGLAVNVTPDLPVTDDDLTCTVTTASTDPDGDTVTYTYNWYKNTVFNQTTSKTGLTDTLSKTKTKKGEIWNCTVTPSDGSANGPSASDQVTIQNSAPTAPVVDVTPNSPKTDDDLTCTVTTASSDLDGDSITYTYSWYKNGVLNQTTSKPGLTDTLAKAKTTKGEVWNCTVTASDGFLSSSPASDQVTIQNSPPTAPVVDVTPNSPITTDDLTCTVTTQSTDPDGDTLTYTYKWYKDGVLNKTTSGTSSLTDILSNTLTSDGEVWKCVVSANDGTIDGSTAQDQVTIGAANLVIDSIVVQTGGCNVFMNDTYVNGTNYYVPVEVKVKNIGIGTAGSFNVSLSTYSYNISLQEDYFKWLVTGLNPGENTTLVFNWRPLHTGNYSLTAIADCDNAVVETNESDNSLVLSQPVFLIGDANGDGTVNIVDAVVVSLAWNAIPGGPTWNIKADLNHNGVVNVSDGVRIGLHWNQTW